MPKKFIKDFPYKRGELVWVKFYADPWWPAAINKIKENGLFEVFFCGTDEKATLPEENIAKWAENFDDFILQTEEEEFLFSVGIALKLQEQFLSFENHESFIKECDKQEIINEIKEFINFNYAANNNNAININQPTIDYFLKSENNFSNPTPNKFLGNKRKFTESKKNEQFYNDSNIIKDILLSNTSLLENIKNSYGKIEDYKSKIIHKLSKSEKSKTNISSELKINLQSNKNITNYLITNEFPKFISDFQKCLFGIKMENYNPNFYKNYLDKLKNIYTEDENFKELNCYKRIYHFLIDILNEFHYLPNKFDKNGKIDLAAPSLVEFVNALKTNDKINFHGVTFKNTEVTIKHTKYRLRINVREIFIKLIKEIFYYIDNNFLVNFVGGLEFLASKCTSEKNKVGKEYIVNCTMILKKIKKLMFEDSNNSVMTQEKNYDLSLNL